MSKRKKRKARGRTAPSSETAKRRECEKARKRIFHLLDGRLTSAKALEMKRHLAVCRKCCSHFEFMRVLKHVIKAKVLSHGCPGALPGRVRKAVLRLVQGR